MSQPIPINNNTTNNKTCQKKGPHSSSWSLYGSSPGGSMYMSGIATVENQTRPYCHNCGKYDHYFRQCREPVTSMGIITYRINKTGVREYLMIRRRYTLGFIEFVMGHYSSNDPESIIILFKQMIKDEFDLISRYKNNFEELWTTIWKDNIYNSKFKKDKEQSDIRFSAIQKNNSKITLDECLTIKPLWETPEWGFAKGRRNAKETNIEAGLREFEEETGYSRKDLIINSTEELIEMFNGTNGILYRHIYYVAECFKLDMPVIDMDNSHQMNEIGAIKWFLLEDALANIRDHHAHKKKVLLLVDSDY